MRLGTKNCVYISFPSDAETTGTWITLWEGSFLNSFRIWWNLKPALDATHTHTHILTFHSFTGNLQKFICGHQLRTSNLGRGVQMDSVKLSFVRYTHDAYHSSKRVLESHERRKGYRILACCYSFRTRMVIKTYVSHKFKIILTKMFVS